MQKMFSEGSGLQPNTPRDIIMRKLYAVGVLTGGVEGHLPESQFDLDQLYPDLFSEQELENLRQEHPEYFVSESE